MASAAGDDRSAAPSWLPPGVPLQLGQYRLVRPLGRGGIGVVFEGRHRLLEQRVAVKVLHPQHANDPTFVARFRREMAAFGRVPEHPNLVRAQYAGEEEGVQFLVMDFVDGSDLSRVLQGRGSLSVPAACAAVLQALGGLEAIHRAGLVHRDLKPANLILTADGTVKILDLGLARLRDPQGGEELTPSSVMLGTFDYLAPEQASDARQADIRADIYSLGCTLYRLITGAVPFAGGSLAEKVRAHALDPFPPLGTVAPLELNTVLARMTAKAPAARFATPAEAAAALAPFADPTGLFALHHDEPGTKSWDRSAADTPGASGLSATPLPSTATPRPPRKPRPVAVVALTGVVALACGFFAVGNGNEDEHASPLTPAASAGERGTPADETPAPQVTPKPVPGPLPAPKLPDVLPAGSTLRNLDALAPFEHHDLLTQPPIEAVWNPAGGLAARSFEAAGRRLRVDSPRESLFHLGTTRAPSFGFKAQIRQSNWRGGPGLYFGYRPTKPPEPAGAVFQFLMFTDRMSDNGKHLTCVSRGRGRVTFDKSGKPVVSLPVLKDEPVGTPLESATLSLEVRDGRLIKVRLNGEHELKPLALGDIAKKFTPEDAEGAVGLMVVSNNSVFTDVLFEIKGGR